MATKIPLGTIGFILVVLTASVYFMWPENIRIDFENTKTIYSVYENGSFIPKATEYSRLFDGTKLMRAKSRDISYDIGEEETIVTRTSVFKDDIISIDTYTFDHNADNIENVPIFSLHCFQNAEGKIYEYQIDKIDYEGETDFITSPFEFPPMKVTWEDGSHSAKVYNYKAATDKIKIRYRINEPFKCFDIRLFDPPKKSTNTENISYGVECNNVTWIVHNWTYDNGTLDWNGTWVNGTWVDHFINMSAIICVDNIMLINMTAKDKLYLINVTDFGGCTFNNTCTVCDSKYDGNEDGICNSGESCMQYCITDKDKLEMLEKNSRHDYVKVDSSFKLKKPKVKENDK